MRYTEGSLKRSSFQKNEKCDCLEMELLVCFRRSKKCFVTRSAILAVIKS